MIMDMHITNRNFYRVVACFCVASMVGPAHAGFDVFSVGGDSDPSSIAATIDEFRAALGDPNNANAPGPLETGRREINWDGGGATTAAAAGTPFTGFLNNRGATFTTPGSGFLQTPVTDVALTAINPAYADTFSAFSPVRIFTPLDSNITDVTFSIPGSNGEVPATVTGFGAVFTDVDLANTTSLEFFNSSGRSILLLYAEPGTEPDGSLSFLGAVANAGETIARVRITTGTTALGPSDDTSVDVVAMDDFIYSEPSPDPGPTGIETLTNFVDALSDEAFKAPGHRNALLSMLRVIQDQIDAGDGEDAIRKLDNLRKKFQGCDGSSSETAALSDWIADCVAQREFRGLIDDLLTSL